MTSTPLPAVIRCSRPGCPHTIDSNRLPAGWILLLGDWICREDAERIRLGAIFEAVNADILDGIEQGDPTPAEDAVLFDPEQTQDMPAPEDDP